MADIFWDYLYLFATVCFVIPNLSFMIFGSVVVFGAEGIDEDSNNCSYGPYMFAYISLIMRNYSKRLVNMIFQVPICEKRITYFQIGSQFQWQ